MKAMITTLTFSYVTQEPEIQNRLKWNIHYIIAATSYLVSAMSQALY